MDDSTFAAQAAVDAAIAATNASVPDCDEEVAVPAFGPMLAFFFAGVGYFFGYITFAPPDKLQWLLHPAAWWFGK